MGVVYKLKQEIIDFIISNKRKDPFLSCRKMAIMVNADFQIEVSKSSINAVFKEFNLSGPVGRRAKAPSSKNFAIPSDRKENLLKSVAPFLTTAVAPPSMDILPVVIAVEPLPVVPEIRQPSTPALLLGPIPDLVQLASQEQASLDPVAPTVKMVVVDVPVPLSLAPDILQEAAPDDMPTDIVLSPADEPELDQPLWATDPGPLYDKLGVLVFVTAARQAFEGLGLGKTLMMHTGQKDDPELYAALEDVFFCWIFFKDSGALFEGERGPLEALGISRHQAQEWIVGFAGLKTDPQWCDLWASWVATATTMVRTVRCTVAGHEAVDLPAPFAHGWGFLTSVVTRVAYQAVARSEPLIMGSLEYGLSSDKMILLLRVLMGEETFSLVELFSSNGNLLHSFPWTLSGKCEFIFGIPLTERDIMRLEIDLIDNSHAYLDPFSGRVWSCQQGAFPIPGGLQSVRVLILSCEGQAGHFGIVTSHKGAIKDILKEYFRREISRSTHSAEEISIFSGENGLNIDINGDSSGQSKPPKHSMTLDNILFRKILEFLMLPSDDMGVRWQEEVLSYSGSMRMVGSLRLIRLQLPTDASTRGLCEQALSYVNAQSLSFRVGEGRNFSCK